METLGILEEIEALVSDKLEVVSYKWLSRNFLVSSNAAKRLLQEFVEKHKSGLEVVYAISGWLKNGPQSYCIRLVLGPKLEEVKNEYEGNCSVHVYSVQAAIPKDPAALWNDEFVQAEELFKQPPVADNCLRDNRFCGIVNPFVKRNIDGAPVSNAALLPKSVGVPVPGPSKSNSTHENIKVTPQQIKVEQSGPKLGKQSTLSLKDVKSESHEAEDQSSKPSVHEEKAIPLAASEKKGQGDKSSSSLASLWGRASVKSKVTSAEDDNHPISNPTASAEAQICNHEAVEDLSSDDEAKDVNFKRASNGNGGRKRRVVLDYSDDEFEDIVSLASPDLPKEKKSKPSPPKEPTINGQTENKLKVKEEMLTDSTPEHVPRKISSVSNKRVDSKDSFEGKVHDIVSGGADKADIATKAAPNSPKRKKVLRTRIDERGREVNEVVWEGEDTETNKADSNATKKADSNATKKAESNAIMDAVTIRAPTSKKSPAAGNVAPSNAGGKAGNKKGGCKDPKQGNILSFFKRV